MLYSLEWRWGEKITIYSIPHDVQLQVKGDICFGLKGTPSLPFPEQEQQVSFVTVLKGCFTHTFKKQSVSVLCLLAELKGACLKRKVNQPNLSWVVYMFNHLSIHFYLDLYWKVEHIIRTIKIIGGGGGGGKVSMKMDKIAGT